MDIRRACILLLSLSIVLPPGTTFAAASAVAAGKAWFTRSKNSQTDFEWFRKPGPALKANITWTSGTNTADDTTCAAKTYGPEKKFDDLGGFPFGRTYTGFSDSCGPGTYGSKAKTTGTGDSNIGWLVAEARMRVDASGTLGTPPTGKVANYTASARADDPWQMTVEDLLDPLDSAYDLYIPFSILGGASDGFHSEQIEDTIVVSNSGFGFGIGYETASEFIQLLQIDISGASVSILSNLPPSARIFRLPAFDSAPDTQESNLITLDEILALLSADLEPDFSIDTPLYLGLFLDDIPIPASAMENGALAQVHQDAWAFDSARATNTAPIPEPSSLWLMISACLALRTGAVALKRRNLHQ